ncbi:MAG: hypothetical protein AAGH78_02195 [Cyanobacteria bacterium P01_H01_bin.58]
MTTLTPGQPPNILVRILFQSMTDENLWLQIFWLLIWVSAGGLMIHNGLDKLAMVC